MSIKWKKSKKLKPHVILSKIDSIKTVSEDKKISFSGFEYQDAMAVLVNMVDFPKKLEGVNRENIVSRAVANVAKSFELDENKVIHEINKVLKADLSIQEQKFHVLTNISLRKPYPFKTTVLEGVKIRILPSWYPKKYKGRKKLISKHRDIEAPPIDYANVIISLKDKTVKGAASKALRIIDIERSLLCLLGNSSMEFLGNQWEPINKIRLGSAHTVHNESGEVASDIFWYEPNFSSTFPFKPSNPITFNKNYKWAKSQLEKSLYGEILKEALLRFVRALDERDQNVALIRLWSALEVLTAPKDTNYDLVTRRCAFLFADYEYHKQILEHLREYRNANVHAGDQSENVKSDCYRLQYYFYNLILFHLRNSEVFTSLEEANSFLDLPKDKHTLETKIKLMNKAIDFIS